MKRIAWVMLAANVTLLSLGASARSTWVVDDGHVTRIDFAAGIVEPVPVIDRVLDVAPAGDAGAWILTNAALLRVDDELEERSRAVLTPDDRMRIGPMAADRADGSIWLGVGSELLHVNGDGVLVRRVLLDGPALAVTVVGPDAVFAATAHSVTRFDAEGSLVARADLARVGGEGATALLGDPAAGLLWLARNGALVQFDVLVGMSVRAVQSVAPVDAIGIDASSGHVTLVMGREIVRLDRRALPVTGSFASEDLAGVAGIDVVSRDAQLWFGDRVGFGVIDVAKGTVLRIAGVTGVTRFAGDPLHFEARLEADTSANQSGDTHTSVTLRFRAYCDGFACAVSPAYLSGLRLRAQRDGRDVSGLFSANAERDAFSAQVPGSPSEPASALYAWITDSYGNRSADAVVTWPLGPSAGAPDSIVPKAAPTVSITAPLNNATFTAPASTVIKATAAPSTGAAITKVDFYAGPTLLGTVTVSPYNFTWSNVQVGTYALTAKVTDNLNATVTSAVINVTVKPGTRANPLNAWLFNDAFATTKIATDAVGIKNGVLTGIVASATSAATAPKPDTCKAASFNGGAFDVAALTVSTAAAAKVSVAFWMYWNGTDAVMPIGWVKQGLVLSGGSFGFTTQNGDVFGIASTGFINKWVHVVAEFVNGSVSTNKLYINGVLQTLTQRAGTPNVANAVVAAALRVGGLSGNAGFLFKGHLDEVRVYNRALTATEVSAEFAAANACGTAPTVSMTSPATGTNYVAPFSIPLAATAAATATGATLTKVEFYNGSTLLSADTASPYAYTWSNVGGGNYTLTAKATDSKGTTATSVVTVSVKANVAPTVAVTAPANNAAYTAPATINLAANAADSDGTVAKVEFFQGATRLTTLTAAPYTYTWNNVAGGNYALTAKATDDRGLVTTSGVVNVKVNKRPTVSITSPANNATIVLPATINVNVSASDADGSITRVEFYRDGVLLATDTASPYTTSWTIPAPGTYVLTAKATDNLGVVTTSAAVTIVAKTNAAASVVITAPATGTPVWVGIPLTINATATDTDGTISKVEFYADTGMGPVKLATDTTSPYSVSVSLTEGTNVLTAIATDNKGATTTSAPVYVPVTQNEGPVVTMTAPSPDSFNFFITPTPPNVALAATASDVDGRVVSVRFYKQRYGPKADPDPVLLGTVTTPPYQVTYASVPHNDPPVRAGQYDDAYSVWAEATDDFGNVTVAGAGFVVLATAPPSYYRPEFTMPGYSYGIPTFNIPATIVIGFDNAFGHGCGQRTDIFANGTLIGSVTAADVAAAGRCLYVWRNVPPGSYRLTATLVDELGFLGTSTSGMTFNVVNPAAPSTTITMQQPVNGQFIPGGGISFAASVTDTTGTLRNVVLSDNYEGIFADSTAPYGTTNLVVDTGIHVLQAKAVDIDILAEAPPVYIAVPYAGYGRPGVAVLTSPSPTGTYSNTTPFTISADVVSQDQPVTKVEFYDGGYLIASDNIAPYSVQVIASGGTHSFYAAVYSANDVTVSAPVTINVSGTGAGAQIALTSPIHNQKAFVGTSVPLTVNLTDPAHLINKVEYWKTDAAGAQLLSATTSAPWSSSWVVPYASDYAITAVALYTGGRVTSPAATIHGVVNQSPVVDIVSPRGVPLYVGQVVPIVVAASDPENALAMVEVFVDGVLKGTVTTPPYTVNWTPSAAGTYQLTAKATDALGLSVTTQFPLSATVATNVLPTVTLVQPQSGQTFSAGGTINLIATAADSGGFIQRVDFFVGSTLIGTATIPPYAYAWTNVAAGSYSLTARATDNNGAPTTSAPVSVTVQPLGLTITSPANGATIPSDFVLIKGTFQAPPNSGVSINGSPANSDGTNFFVNNFALSPGANTLTITLTTADGQTVTQTRTVTSTATSPYRIEASADALLAPASVVLRVTKRIDRKIVNLQIANFSGTVDASVFDGETLVRLTFAAPGRFEPVITIQDDQGGSYTQPVAILIIDRNALGAMLKTVWTGFVSTLSAGDNAAALRKMSDSVRWKYTSTIDVLSPYMAQIVSTWSAPAVGMLGSEVGELVVTRDVQGVGFMFFIYLLRERDGVWRLVSM